MTYIDIHINGAFGVDFNDSELTLDQFRSTCLSLEKIGVLGFLPTIITDTIESMTHRIHKIASFIDQDADVQRLVLGIHVEGPFLSSQTGFFGTHPQQHLHQANIPQTMQLLEAGAGHIKLMTLAPEQDAIGAVTKLIRSSGVLVMAGHTNASMDELKRSLDAGLVGFTHLGNGCVHQVDRQNNIMQRVLALKDHLFVTFIADGIHVPAWLLQSWIDIIGPARSIIISDSISAAGMPAGDYRIAGQPIQVDEHRRTRHRDHGYLAGSASTLADMDSWMHHAMPMTNPIRERLFRSNALNLLALNGANDQQLP
jgi:N-acetylglucosamine-6-phosphate deacetylase